MVRTLVIGDVHGCRAELERLLDKCGAGEDTRILQVGDLVAKGPDSAGVLRVCRERGVLSVLGNHDARVLERRAQADAEAAREHDRVAAALTAEDWAYLEALPLWRELPEYDALIVHAGLVPGVPLEAQRREHLLTLRSITPDGVPTSRREDGEPWASRWPGPTRVLFGHDAVRGFQQHPFAIGLDTGCVYGGALTAWLLPGNTRVSVPAERACAPKGEG